MKKVFFTICIFVAALSLPGQARDLFRPQPAPHIAQPETTYYRIACINGRTVPYDACTFDATPPGKNWCCIGQGTIYSINGVIQTGSEQFYFWVAVPGGCRSKNRSSDTN